jgi:hypothetical protein
MEKPKNKRILIRKDKSSKKSVINIPEMETPIKIHKTIKSLLSIKSILK